MNIEDSGVLAVLENLMMARAKLMGKSKRGRIEAIRDLIATDYNFENVQKLFKSAMND